MKKIFLVLTAILTALGIFVAQKISWNPIERSFFALGQNPGFVPKAAELKPVLFGFDHFAADLFWLRAIQYAGSNAVDSHFDALPAYLNLVVDLDPHFLFPYRFGALILPINPATKNAVEPLLKKGISKNPDVPELLLDLGFFQYFYENKNDAAIENYEKCFRKFQNCPRYARNVAANLREKKGKYEIALRTWLEKLRIPDLTGQEQKVVARKIEETSKLIALNCALKKKPDAKKVSDLVGISVQNCAGFREISPAVFGALARKYDLFHITKKTIQSPIKNNPFVIKSGRVATKR